ncbi:MAG: hypothetical protein AB7O52_04845, partial [Planctomycetota bacterium]
TSRNRRPWGLRRRTTEPGRSTGGGCSSGGGRGTGITLGRVFPRRVFPPSPGAVPAGIEVQPAYEWLLSDPMA